MDFSTSGEGSSLNRPFAIVGVMTLALVAASPAAAETFVLASGGRITGELLNPNETPRERYVIKTAAGQVTLAKDQVVEVQRPSAAELEYERLRPRVADTVEAQWKLAQWCQEQNLTAQRKKHLERIVELEPDHVEARRLLGYMKIEGKWVTREESMKSRGMVYFRGRWVTPQHVQIIEGREKSEAVEREWTQKLTRWRGWLGTDRDAAARKAIEEIQDPAAIKALAQGLEQDQRYRIRVLMIEALARIGTPEAMRMLANTALKDANEEVRLSCLDQLKVKKHPDVVALFVAQLKHKDNTLVNRAAVALAQMNDRSAIMPLIESLVTVHKFKQVSSGSGGPGSISTTFSPQGGGGLSVGGGPKIFSKPIRNQDVLDALVVLSGGAHFGFDENAWRAWYASQRPAQTLDARRGP